MAIVMACGSCGAQLEYRDDDTGRAGQCPTCRGEIRVPVHTKMCVGCRKLVAADAPRCPACGTALGPGAAVSQLPPEMMPPIGATGDVGTSRKAIWSLVLGLISIVLLLTCVTGVPAIVLGVLALADIRRYSGRLEGQGMALTGIVTGALATLLILPLGLMFALGFAGIRASQTAFQSGAFQAPCQNNLRQIGLALHNYHDAYQSFPPVAVYDADGKALLSWRVLILPYLGPTENALYQQFHLDEPWDSPHNRPLADQMPFIFRCPFDPVYAVPMNTTSYVAITGEGTVFPPDRAVKLAEIRDGTGMTGVVGELMSSTIVWTKPEDVAFDENFSGTSGFSSVHAPGWNLLMADGSARFIDAATDADVLRRIMTIAGGEPLDGSEF